LPGRHGCACAAGNRERGLDAGCSAGKSSCPWPPRSPRCVWHNSPPGDARQLVGEGVLACWPARSPGCSFGSQPYRRLSGDCLRVLTRLLLVKPRPSQQTQDNPRWLTTRVPPPRPGSQDHEERQQNTKNCWQPERKLLASGGAVFKPIRTWNSVDNDTETRMADRLADRTIAWLSPARRSQAVAGRLRLATDLPFHICG